MKQTLLISLLLLTTAVSAQEKKLIIAISKTAAESNYTRWLKSVQPDVTIINVYDANIDSVEAILSRCGGLLLTGGGDVIPGIYGKAEESNKCSDFDAKRDSMELKLIRVALKRKMPILGICRGEQILNVANGGTLYTDIPTDIGKTVCHRIKDSVAYHHVKLEKGTQLQQICGVTEGKVTSIHHQAVHTPAPAVLVAAKADDGVVEAIEFKDKNNYPFVIGLQWHPERMDKGNALSTPICKEFIQQAKQYSLSPLRH